MIGVKRLGNLEHTKIPAMFPQFISQLLLTHFKPIGTTTVPNSCKHCGKTYKTSKADIARGAGMFCSISCGRQWNVDNKRVKFRADSTPYT